MNEELFLSILSEAFEREYAELTAGGEHIFSLRHRIRMNKVFRCYEKSIAPDTTLNIKPTLRRRLIVAFIVVFTAIILTVTVVALVINGFKVTEKSDHTEFLAIGSENAPTTIVEIYEPSWIPDGFELTYSNDSRQTTTRKYENTQNEYFYFHQYTFVTAQGIADSERCNPEIIIIDDNNGLFWSDESTNYLYINNDNYIIAVYGNIAKEILIELAKSTKIVETQNTPNKTPPNTD